MGAMLLEEELSVRFLRIAITDRFVEHGNVETLKEVLGLDADSIANKILGIVSNFCRERQEGR